MSDQTEWTAEKEKKILWKYRTVLTLRIIRIIFIILFLFWLYMMVLSIGYHQSSKPEKLNYISQLAIDWTLPGIISENGPIPHTNITPFLTQEITMPLLRTIGKEDIQVGEMSIHKKVFNTFSSMEIKTFNQTNNGIQVFRFSLPKDPKTGEKLKGNKDNLSGAWKTLDKIHEGTVGQLAFSTTKYYTPEELVNLLAPYDLHVLWMPIYMGELQDFEENWGRTSGLLWVNPWGLAGAREKDEHYRITSRITRFEQETQIIQSEESMLKNMKELQNEDSDLIRLLFGTTHLKERISYLENNGFQVYGAVVTGPVKELLKLKELKEIKEVEIGHLTYWNWDNY